MRRRRFLPLVALLALTTAIASAQDTFKPIPEDLQQKYKLSYAQHFFASPAAEKEARATWYKELNKLYTFKGKAASSAKSLYDTLILNDKVQADAARHYMYLYMQYATDTKNTAAMQDFSAVTSDLDSKTRFIQQELLKIDDKTWAKFKKQQPGLSKFEFFVQTARRMRPYTLSLKEEELLGKLRPLALDWQAQLYQLARDRTDFGKVGELDVLQDANAINNSENRDVRKEGFFKEYEAYDKQRDLYAFAITRLCRNANQFAKVSGFADAPSATYFGMWLSSKEVKGLYDQVAKAAELNKRYQQIRAEHVGKSANIPDVDVWDFNVLPPDVPRPRYTITEASQIIENTLKPFGPEYERELADLLNPASGRLDLVKGDNRVPGAFSWGFPGTQKSFFYSFAYEGFYDDVSTLIHESGHAVVTQLMANNKVIPADTNGPNYFTEGFAIFNELLLADYLYKHETNPKLKTWYLQKFMDNAMQLFGITRQARLEHMMYEGVASGKLQTADDFDKLSLDNGKMFSIWYEKHPEQLKNAWIEVHHYFDQPLYYENYVYASFLSLKFFQLMEEDPQKFVPKYLALMRAGFNAPPADLLKKYLGINLQDPNLVPSTVKFLNSRLADLQKLYEQGN